MAGDLPSREMITVPGRIVLPETIEGVSASRSIFAAGIFLRIPVDTTGAIGATLVFVLGVDTDTPATTDGAAAAMFTFLLL